jgi:hypothetical protein
MLITIRYIGDWLSSGKTDIPHIVNNSNHKIQVNKKVHRTIGSQVSLTGRPTFIPRKIPVLIYVRGCVDPRAIMLLEGLGQLKNPMTSS